MNLNAILARVDIERIYQSVLKLEGVKHPIDTPAKLREAGDAICAELVSYGLPVRAQEFRLDGWDDTFRNIEARIGAEDEPAAVLINHYDTVSTTPGANDNAAGVAVMLEAARVLATESDIPAIRFVSATLEEGLPPTAKAAIRKSALQHGLTDARGRYTSQRTAKIMKAHFSLMVAGIEAGKSVRDALADARTKLQDQLTDAISEHLQTVEAAHDGLTTASAIGVTGKIGSGRWVDEAVATGKKIAFAICLDEIGTTSKREHSQHLPAGVSYGMMRTYKVDTEREVGDWAFVLADPAGAPVARAFCDYCKHDSIDLAHAFFQMPDFETIAAHYPQAFGSDHAPFWRASIPAIFAFDTANWRNPYGHSMADTIDRLDFEHITRICKATIATLIDRSLRG
jgi:hypothetical protein